MIDSSDQYMSNGFGAVSRRGLLTGALGGTAALALPAWPAAADTPTAVAAEAGVVLPTHPATEPSGTHVRNIGGTNVVCAYGAVIPSLDGWRTHEQHRGYLNLHGSWRFAFDPRDIGLDHGWQRSDFDDRDWGTIGVPSAWDLRHTPGFGTLDGTDFGTGSAFKDGYAWYRRTLHLDPHWRDRHLRLNFLAVGYSADVWLDGIHLGAHEGASSPFSLPIPAWIRVTGKHTLVVRVYRRASYTSYTGTAEPVNDDLAVPYKPVDYWPYAGITHPVWLEAVATTSIAKVLVGHVDGRLSVRMIMENHGRQDFVGTVHFDPGHGSRAASQSRQVHVPAASATVVALELAVSHAPHWSADHPRMLTAHVSLRGSAENEHGRRHHDRHEEVDTLSVRYGIRTLEVRDGALAMDDADLFLKGLSWHEETAAHGRAMSLPEYRTELAHVRDLGANFIRNCVYTRHPYVYDWADESGVMVMDDIDTMWLNTKQEQLQTEDYGLCRALALTMAWNQHNHPSVILWGLQNESEIDPAGAPVYRAWLADLKAAVKSVDLTRRPVTWASSTSNDPAFDLADVVGFNEYFGYFYGASDDLGPTLDAVHAAYPDKPILITENGTYALPGNHGSATEVGTEEFQADYIADHWAQIVARKSFMAGYTLWVLKDYKERDGYNQKYNGVSVLGLLSFDTEEEKLAYGRFKGL